MTNFINLSYHFPALIIIVPLMAAPLCVLLRHSSLSWLLALAVNAIVVVMAALLFLQVEDGNIIRYSLGGWAAPTGIEYYVDTVNAMLLTLIASISCIVLIYSQASIRREIAEPRHYLFYTGWLLCLTGLLGIVMTGDAFNVFVFLEISSLSMYMLIALGRERKQALMAAFRYLIMGSVGASFILIGIGFLYAATGTLNMIDLSERIPEVGDSRTVLVAFSFITLGLMIKAAVFPVYSWLPSAYQYAPTAVTSFLSATATKVSIYLLLRFFFQLFGAEYSFEILKLGNILLPVAVVGFLLMSLVAIFQQDIRRILAYSSVAQVAYILVGISLATQEGLTASIVHIINHAFIKAALFVAVGCMIYRLGDSKISSVGGLIRTMPWTSGAFIIAGLGLIGVPLTSGFVSKWYLITAVISHTENHSGWWIIVGMILISSLMAIIYVGKVIEAFYFKTENKIDDIYASTGQESTGQESTVQRNIVNDSSGHNKKSSSEDPQEAPLSMLIPLWVLVIISLYTGIDTTLVVDIASTSAAQLLDGFSVDPIGGAQ